MTRHDDAPTERDYRSLAAFRHSLRVFQRFSEDAARDAGVTPAQHQLMLAVKGWPDDEPPAISGLAAFLQLRHHSTVELIQRAVAAGLVTTTTDPGDQRRQLIGLTPKGERILASLSALHRTELIRFRADMNEVLGDLG